MQNLMSAFLAMAFLNAMEHLVDLLNGSSGVSKLLRWKGHALALRLQPPRCSFLCGELQLLGVLVCPEVVDIEAIR